MAGEAIGSLQIIPETIAQIAERSRARAGAPFDPKLSRWHSKVIFIVGAPRSGTSWLHQMMLTHPDIATGGELHVFCEGLDGVFENFEDPDPYMHLSSWIARPELVALARQFIDGVFSTAATAARPGATRVLDKTPNHVHTAARQAEVYPDATYIHIVRNPRDAVSSQHDLWGGWHERSQRWELAASDWAATVRDCRAHFGALKYHEVRYEDLLAHPVDEVRKILIAANLDYTDELIEAIVDFGKAPVNVRPSDRRISDAKWKDIDPLAEREIALATGDLMVELGYVTRAELEEILGRRSLRRTIQGVPSMAGKLAQVAARKSHTVLARARARLGHKQQSSEVRALAHRLVKAAQETPDALIDLLAPDATIVLPDGVSITGRDEVSAELIHRLAGATARPVMADNQAAAVEVISARGSRQHHRYYVGSAGVTLIVLEGSGE